MMQKKIVLFGTGKYFDNYMMCYGQEKPPLFAVDNDPLKSGMVKSGVAIEGTEKLLTLNRDEFYVIICCAQRDSIAGQLEDMGICDYQFYVPVPVEEALPMTLSADCTAMVRCDEQKDGEKKPYKIGYVPGVFDLFHVGHLNLLRNSKRRSEFLIVGVLTDELVEHFKGRKPVIPYAQRAAVVSAISYVDRVVPVDFDNTVKIDAWKRYRFDCHFSGNDHGMDWVEDIKQLREVDSNMEFFQYTKATSSTQIRNQKGV